VAQHLAGVGGGLRISPYTVVRIAEDPRSVPGRQVEFEKYMRENWTRARVAAMSTPELEAQLERYGVRFSAEDFVALARGRRSAWSMSEVWQRDPVRCRGKDEDFLGLAACELWKRLVRGPPSDEMIDDWMQEGYELREQGRSREAADLWWKVWCALRERFTPEMKSIWDADEVFDGSQSVGNWCQDAQDAFEDAARDDPSCARLGLRFCDEWLAQFAGDEIDATVHFLRSRAALHFHLGDMREGLATLESIVRRWPRNPWGYIALADAHSHLFETDPGPPLDTAAAFEWLRRGEAAADREHTGFGVLAERRSELERR